MLRNEEALTILEEQLKACGFTSAGHRIFVALAEGVTVEVTMHELLVSVDGRQTEDVDAVMVPFFAQALSFSDPVTCAKNIGENLLHHVNNSKEAVNLEDGGVHSDSSTGKNIA